MSMTPEQIDKAANVLVKLISKHKSIREFAVIIKQDSADVTKWKSGIGKVNPRATVSICRLYGVEPHLLRPDIFDEDVHFNFEKTVKTKR